MALSGERELVIDSVNGVPRANSYGTPDSYQFDIHPVPLSIHDSKFPPMVRRAIGYCLRSRIQPTLLESACQLPRIAQVITSALLSFNLKRAIWAKVCQGVGFDDSIKESRANTFFIGYFQSYKWLEIARQKQNLDFKLSAPSELVDLYKDLAHSENPLVVHVRLGDYLNEGGFGTLNQDYYETAINYATSLKDFGKIWLFSDDPTEAIKRLPNDLSLEVRVMPAFEGSPATAMEVMKFGKGYVIANSTFSWWGAALSYESEPVVTYPYPWFKSLDSPLDLVPPNWLPIRTL